VIFLSGADADDDRILGLSIGGVDYVSKPFSPGELHARIQVHLNRPGASSRAAHRGGRGRTHGGGKRSGRGAGQRRQAPDQRQPGGAAGLAEIARSVGTYREKLSQVFREQTGMTVFGFIREERIRRGEELLKDTDIDVQDIALLIGFNNAGNFATAFRERMGVTPTAYRQAIQKK
jgi:AraC-like DNA-binding protein